MVKATWAVACLLTAVLFGIAGCATGKVAQAPYLATGSVGVGGVDNAAKVIPQPQVFGAEAGSQYRLGPEDLLRVSVWENKDLTLDLVVRPDGKISMPLIQDVIAEGLTVVDLAIRIREKLAAFINEPQVSVIVLQVNAPKYYIVGSVVKPGTYPLRSDISVLQALALAGGFTQFASPRSIKLIRNLEGKQVIRKINYYDVIDEGGEGNYILKSGDTIVVP